MCAHQNSVTFLLNLEALITLKNVLLYVEPGYVLLMELTMFLSFCPDGANAPVILCPEVLIISGSMAVLFLGGAPYLCAFCG